MSFLTAAAVARRAGSSSRPCASRTRARAAAGSTTSSIQPAYASYPGRMSELRVGVIGAGVMGCGIAQTLAVAGYETVCCDVAEAALERARRDVATGRF